jgi:non-specific serine/threonine protein kinase/serine/threonine-protein kinase
VIHRDLRPGNILVTESGGTAKLLDFGIAKLLAAERAGETLNLTRAGLHPMTPAYASPEQVLARPVTTATDVYSLGAVLYQLLTRQMPLAVSASSAAAIERTICEEQPRPPSQVAPAGVARELRGDLDTIILKALQKEPARRYASVERLAADIQCFLDGRPILARPQTVFYRTARFVRRNRASVGAAVLVLLSLTGGLGVALYQAHVARVERARAERRFNDVRRLAHTFLFDFHDAIQNLPGSTPARHLVVNKALEYLNGLARESEGDAALQRELAEAYLRVGDLQGNGRVANLNDPAGATVSIQRALELAERAVQADPRNAESRSYLARAHMGLGDMRSQRNDAAGAAAHYRPAIAAFESIAARFASDVPMQFEIGNAHASLADVLGNPRLPNLGDARAAKEEYEKARSIFAAVARAHPDNVRAQRAVGNMEMRIGDTEVALNDPAGSLRHYQAAVTTIEAALARDPLNPATRMSLGMALGKIAGSYEVSGQTRRALDGYRSACSVLRALMQADTANSQAASAYAFSLHDLAELQANSGDRTGALATYREELSITRPFLAADPNNPRRQARVLETEHAVGKLAHSSAQPAASR